MCSADNPPEHQQQNQQEAKGAADDRTAAPPLERSRSPLSAAAAVVLRVDERLTRPILEMTLPTWAEFVLSLPGNAFGMAPCVTVGPIWTMIVLWRRQQPAAAAEAHRSGLAEGLAGSTARLLLLEGLAGILTVVFLTAWYEFNVRENLGVLERYFTYVPLYFAGATLSTAACCLASGLLSSSGGGGGGGAVDDDEARRTLLSMSLYPNVLWQVSLAACLALKNTFRRSRPCWKDPGLLAKKRLPSIPALFVLKKSLASFPSADSAGAVAFALPIAASHPAAALAVVAAASFGRVYFLAHHLLDCLAGFAVTLSLHAALTAAGIGLEGTAPWHPFAAMLLLAATVKVQKARYG